MPVRSACAGAQRAAQAQSAAVAKAKAKSDETQRLAAAKLAKANAPPEPEPAPSAGPLAATAPHANRWTPAEGKAKKEDTAEDLEMGRLRALADSARAQVLSERERRQRAEEKVAAAAAMAAEAQAAAAAATAEAEAARGQAELVAKAAAGVGLAVAAIVHGLEMAPQHNGKRATVREFDEERGRWLVEREDGTQLKIRPLNLRAAGVPAPAPSAGWRA